MKIAVLSFYSGLVNRGAENWVYELFSRLSKKHEVTVFQNGERMDAGYKQVLLSTFAGRKRSPLRDLLKLLFLDSRSLAVAVFTIKAIPYLFGGRFDIVLPINGGWQAFLVRFVTFLTRSKMVVVGHSGRGWDDRVNLWAFPSRFVTLTKTNEEWARTANPLARVCRIPNGVDLDRFNPSGESQKIDLPGKIVLCASALVRTKRIDLTIRAVSELPGVSLLVAGEGEERERLSILGKKMLGDRFAIRPYAYGDMPSVYRSCDVFTLVSWENESFPLVYLEAMASGLPVVATRDESREEIVGDAGVLVDPEDTKAYAGAIREILSKKSSYKAREQSNRFSWEAVAKMYEKCFLEITKK